jgi:HD-like signal output (HDOD) protein
MPQHLRLLFVDDEARLLDGIVRMLRPMREQWEVVTANSGQAGLAIMEQAPADIVISDMRMPEMDGAQFLSAVAERWPNSIRFILSGQADRESLIRSIASTHRYLAKPCSAALLQEHIHNACHLRERIHNQAVVKMVGHADTLPVIPDLYKKIIGELQRPESSLKYIADMIAQDMSMTAKLLQLINSARFGINHRVTSIHEVVELLGIDLVRQLVLAAKIFEACIPPKNSGLEIKELWQHALHVATAAQSIARSLHWSADLIHATYTAGLLHDCGQLVLAQHAPEDYARSRALALQQRSSAETAEEAIFHTAHPEVGAYLLGLWGLPDILVEATTYHHHPSACPDGKLSPLTLIHVAQAEIHAQQYHQPPLFDLEYLTKCQAVPLLPAWRKLINDVLSS